MHRESHEIAGLEDDPTTDHRRVSRRLHRLTSVIARRLMIYSIT